MFEPELPGLSKTALIKLANALQTRNRLLKIFIPPVFLLVDLGVVRVINDIPNANPSRFQFFADSQEFGHGNRRAG